MRTTDRRESACRTGYRPPPYRVLQVRMAIDLDPRRTVVRCEFDVVRAAGRCGDLELLGGTRRPRSLTIDGHPLDARARRSTNGRIVLKGLGTRARIRVTTLIDPTANLSMLGLYASAGALLTQCEAEGFRQITWFPDRPDIGAPFTVLLRADRARYPTLLCNGELTQAGTLDRGRHYALWCDERPKPSYLFALVAGRFARRVTHRPRADGRSTEISLWASRRDVDQLDWPHASLVQAIDWDRRRYGLELDVASYMLVGARDTNCEAMENQGLNIFNVANLLASPRSQTDEDFLRVRRIVAHEYFHHWTGNHVTVRDWFQLGLKEGLTTFREQQFAADALAAGLAEGDAALAHAFARIVDLDRLEREQWAEDLGPMAHPIRLERYTDIANFYSATVYDKSAEWVRMLHAVMGERAFGVGLRRFLDRHGGGAATFEDLVASLSAATRRSLRPCLGWLSQRGRPRVAVRVSHRADGAVEVELRRHGGALHRSAEGRLVPIPVTVTGLDPAGAPALLRSRRGRATADEQAFTLRGMTATRSFVPATGLSAARLCLHVREQASSLAELSVPRTPPQLAWLALHHPNAVERWKAVRELAHATLRPALEARPQGESAANALTGLFAALIAREHELDAYRAQMLTLPDDACVAQRLPRFDPAAVRAARAEWLRSAYPQWAEQWPRLVLQRAGAGTKATDLPAMGRRMLRDLALAYWVGSGDPQAIAQAQRQLEAAASMTDAQGALTALMQHDGTDAEVIECALDRFLFSHRRDPLGVDRWFALQAGSPRSRAADIAALLRDRRFRLQRPNHVRAVLTTFFQHNGAAFHAPDGSGYRLWLDVVPALDRINDELAAELLRGFDPWHRLPDAQRMHALGALRGLHGERLSAAANEVISHQLEAADRPGLSDSQVLHVAADEHE